MAIFAMGRNDLWLKFKFLTLAVSQWHVSPLRKVWRLSKLIKKGWAFKTKWTSQEGVGMSFICDITTILKLLMNIIEIVVNYYNLYDDLTTNFVVTSQLIAQTKVINETFLKLFAVKAQPYFKKPWKVVLNTNIFFSSKWNIFLELRHVSLRYDKHKKFGLKFFCYF